MSMRRGGHGEVTLQVWVLKIPHSRNPSILGKPGWLVILTTRANSGRNVKALVGSCVYFKWEATGAQALIMVPTCGSGHEGVLPREGFSQLNAWSLEGASVRY